MAGVWSLTSSQLYYPANGDIREAEAPQLWYRGYWKHVRPSTELLCCFSHILAKDTTF